MTATLASTLENLRSTNGEQLANFIRDLTADAYEGPDRRIEQRYPLLVSVQAQAIDADGNRTGVPISGISRDLSASGISILTVTPIAGRRVALRMSRKDVGMIEILLDVVRSRAIGPFFETAGRFIADPTE
jgi:hypothetical protein